MQLNGTVTPVSPSLAQTDASPLAPIELSPEMLALVSGGSPRGGWELPVETAVDTDPSPRGGW